MILIGFMGSGKSSIARKLHKDGHTYVDLDTYIEETEKLKISDIFSTHGEDYFRKLEYNALKTVIDSYDVISTGGGIVTYKPSFELLEQTPRPIIWLDAPVHILISRSIGDRARPLAQDRRAMRARYKSRLELYESLSDIRIDTSQNKNKCVKQINAFLKDW